MPTQKSCPSRCGRLYRVQFPLPLHRDTALCLGMRDKKTQSLVRCPSSWKIIQIVPLAERTNVQSQRLYNKRLFFYSFIFLMEFHLGAIYCKCYRLAIIRSALQPCLGRFQMGAAPQDSVLGPLAHTGFKI